MYQDRTYRNLIQKEDVPFFKIIVKETDLYVHAPTELEAVARDLVLQHRGYIESYIKRYPEFAKTLSPWHVSEPVPLIIQDMITAGEKAGVGPMAAVAGAIAEHLGIGILSHTDEVMVENGGDVFLKTDGPVVIGIFAGKSPLSLRVGLRVDSKNRPVSVCTSSGTVGHSLSLGKTDAVCVVSESCALADAAATSIGNQVVSEADIQKGIDFGKNIQGTAGIVIIMGDKIGAWGELEIVPIKGRQPHET